MDVQHVRTGKSINLSRSLQFLGQDRVQLEEAFPGDVIGLWDPGVLRIGDTLCAGPPLEFEGVPRFSPEHFVQVRLKDAIKRKQLQKGLDQLSEEGAIQVFFDRRRLGREPVLGAVGVLQFEVTQHRLASEYGARVEFDRLSFIHARWIEDAVTTEVVDKLERSGRAACVVDVEGRVLLLFETDWNLRMMQNEFPNVKLMAAVQPGRSSRAAG